MWSALIASLALTTLPALAVPEQPKTVDAKEATLKAGKTEKLKESPKAKKVQKHSRKHTEAPKAN